MMYFEEKIVRGLYQILAITGAVIVLSHVYASEDVKGIENNNIIDALKRCDQKVFVKLGQKDFDVLSKEGTFDASYEEFISNLLDDKKKVKQDCKELLQIMGENNFKFYHPNTLLKLFSLNSTEAIDEFLNNNLVSEMVIEGNLTRFALLVSNFKNAELIPFYEFQIYRTVIEHFFNKYPKRSNVHFASYEVGNVYFLCGFNQDAHVHKKEKNHLTSTKIKKCVEPYTDVSHFPPVKEREFYKGIYEDAFEVKVVSVDGEWIEIQQLDGSKKSGDHSEFTSWVKASTITTLHVLSDRVFIVPLPKYTEFTIYTEDITSMYLGAPIVKENIEQPIVFQFIKTPPPKEILLERKIKLPVNFNPMKAKIINNIDIITSKGVDGC